MKQSRNLLLLLPALFVGATAVTGFSSSSPRMEAIQFPQAVEAAKLPETQERVTDKVESEAEVESSSVTGEVQSGTGNYEDGIYEGTGTGYSGDVKVKVTVKDHQIASVEIVSNKDDAAFFNRAKALTDKIVKAQTWEVDSVSGATYSSRGIREAVKNALTGSTEKSSPAKLSGKKKKVAKSSYKGSGDWKDGTYTGSAEGYGGTIKVRVTIKNGKIDEISVTSHDGETASYYNKAKKIIAKMIKKQSPNVDTVSGATYSSNGIKNAVIKALKKAEGIKVDDKDTEQDAAEPTTPGVAIGGDTPQEKPAEGTVIKDGTYHVSAECTPDADQDFTAYTISCDVIFKDQKLISMSNFSSTDDSNKTYYNRATSGKGSQTGIVDQLISAQSAANINAVSGATCSSITIRKLYLAALTQATGVEQKDPVQNGQKQDSVETKPDAPESGETKSDTPENGETKSDTPESGETKPDTPEGGETKPDTPDSGETKPDNGETKPDGGNDSGIKDGTYKVSTTVEPDEDHDFDPYTLSCNVTFKDGKVTDMSDFWLSHTTDNQSYTNSAKRAVVKAILERQSADVDDKTGATCSSKAIKELYKAALKKAKE